MKLQSAQSRAACRTTAPGFAPAPTKWLFRTFRRQKLRRQVDVRAAKVVWIETSTKSVLTSAIESGFTKIISSSREQLSSWQQIARFDPLCACGTDIEDSSGAKVGQLWKIQSPDDLKKAERQRDVSGYVVMDAVDWKIIPAENLVALFQGSSAKLLAAATSAQDARVMLEALEIGTAGVVLRTEDPLQVRQLAAYLRQREAQGTRALEYQVARVMRVEAVGMGDRVCVDLASAMVPGEGMLVGSFARCMMLVHSECEESQYINSRPFRVNAGPVHAYVQVPGGRTAYLSELKSGREVVVACPDGSQRIAVVGRVKIEARPLVLVEAETDDGQRHSVLLQNAETVKLVGLASTSLVGMSSTSPPEVHSGIGAGPCAAVSGCDAGPGAEASAGVGADEGCSEADEDSAGVSSVGTSSSIGRGPAGGAVPVAGTAEEVAPPGGGRWWKAISVAEMQAGDRVLTLRQGAARHTGISIQESISER